MVNVRSYPNTRLNVLITEDRPQAPEHWTAQLPRLLEPQGVTAYTARSGREAISVAEQVRIHAAVIDLGTPLYGGDTSSPSRDNSPARPAPGEQTWTGAVSSNTAAGLWLLELLRRLPYRPPVVVVRGPALTQRQFDRVMREALRLGAFSVVNKPVDLEQILTVFRQLIDRRYRGSWPLS